MGTPLEICVPDPASLGDGDFVCSECAQPEVAADAEKPGAGELFI